MATLKEIEDLWAQDAEINPNQLGEEAAKIPKLHNKYYVMMMKEFHQLEHLNNEIKTLERDLYMYYSNRLTDDEVKALGWEFNDRKLIGASEKDAFVNTDKRMIALRLKYSMQKSKVDFLKSILDSVNNRNWIIKSMIDWRKFMSGG